MKLIYSDSIPSGYLEMFPSSPNLWAKTTLSTKKYLNALHIKQRSREKWFRVWAILYAIGIPVLPLTECATIEKLLNVSISYSLHL